jgi:hypothetical protein
MPDLMIVAHRLSAVVLSQSLNPMKQCVPSKKLAA